MLNNRDGKYEGQDDSEYHFSDDEVNYEVESEEQKPTSVDLSKESWGSRLSRSKRMVISGIVFLILVFVVYKMVAPTSSVPSTEMTAASTTQATAQQAMEGQPPATAKSSNLVTPPALVPASETPFVPPTTNVSTPPVSATSQPPVIAPPAQVSQVPQTNVPPPSQNIAAPPMQTQITSGQVTSGPNTPAAPVASSMPVVQQPPASQQLAPQQPIVTSQQPTEQLPAAQQVTASQQLVAPQSLAASQQQLPPVALQQTVPPQSVIAPQPVPVANMPQTLPSSPVSPYTINQPAAAQTAEAVEVRSANLAAESERVVGQLQSSYTQKLNDYSVQNKALQDQVQMLSARVINMENQMNQLVQILTHQPHQESMTTVPAAPQQGQAAESKSPPYTVQAIIPGRAWLRSDNGETLTVAEGDIIKELGRVTKIDPYDGIVEVNTGSKVISLSYGNGG